MSSDNFWMTLWSINTFHTNIFTESTCLITMTCPCPKYETLQRNLSKNTVRCWAVCVPAGVIQFFFWFGTERSVQVLILVCTEIWSTGVWSDYSFLHGWDLMKETNIKNSAETTWQINLLCKVSPPLTSSGLNSYFTGKKRIQQTNKRQRLKSCKVWCRPGCF